jgi:hypothetical protein
MADLELEDFNEAERKTELIATNADLGPNQLKRFADSVVLLIRPTVPSAGNFHALRGIAGGSGSGLIGEGRSGNGVRGSSQSNAGVFGDSQSNIGVFGRGGTLGYGVLGRSRGNAGVVGRSDVGVGV